ncbi:hypothetical protein A2215_01070 [Candidatus Berkelbacteria bacterium RIFOXYA2_FULL_43_10]|uniref:2,3-diketo-5-methylthio-1-phosphopentane phosphatase n=1 Tax=Candidatus Berkelbacteria bacterium RIFOXYA2_FULL_43_10 TaxID=1797472 RepID=A0A1F5EER3_9BACT|nr:MAG: hypothetical protein A2215_01070 [Candidatus Berkelbacteria bacterium RIFOXYA2_FULL_43_10]
MKIKLFIDFDGTLFDTKCFKAKIFGVFLELGFSAEEIEKSYFEECRDYLYNPIDQAKNLCELREFDLESAIAKLREAESISFQCVYDDSLEFLENIDRQKYEVVLLTLGDIGFQKAKFDNSGLNKYFDDALFTKLQKWEYLKDVVGAGEKFILIDDRGDTCAKVAENFPDSKTLEINRRQSAPDPMEPKDDYRGIKIKNFDEAQKYL